MRQKAAWLALSGTVCTHRIRAPTGLTSPESIRERAEELPNYLEFLVQKLVSVTDLLEFLRAGVCMFELILQMIQAAVLMYQDVGKWSKSRILFDDLTEEALGSGPATGADHREGFR